MIANKNDGSFRHPAIEDAEVMLQQLGAQKGFDVDLWDPSWPAQSLPDTPFTSAANLAKYAVIIGNSSVGNNTFNAAYTMKDGTVVNERAAFKGYIRNGGGYVALHAANDSMHTRGAWYKDFLGGLFVQHPANQSALRHRLRLLLLGRARSPRTPRTRRPTRAGKPVKVAVADELYHFDRKPRAVIHPLMLLNEDTYASGDGRRHQRRQRSRAATTRSPGARTSTAAASGRQVLGHNWELSATTPWFRESIYQGILTAAA